MAILESKYSLLMELFDPDKVIDKEHHKQISKANASKLKYNLLKQKLILEHLKESDIFSFYDRDGDKTYNSIIEEASCMALSLSRVVLECCYYGNISLPDGIPSPNHKNWYLISKDFNPVKPFMGLCGEQGKLVVQGNDTSVLGWEHPIVYFDDEDKRIKLIEEGVRLRHRFPDESSALIISQGTSIEHMFGLAPTGYDIIFADVYSYYDEDTKNAYDNLYYYLKDICYNSINFSGYSSAKEIIRYQGFERVGIVTDLIFCGRESVVKTLEKRWFWKKE